MCDWNSRDNSRSYNILILAASRGHPASLQRIDALRMMLKILTVISGGVISEARELLSLALRIVRVMASMWPSTPPLVAEYCTCKASARGRTTSAAAAAATTILITHCCHQHHLLILLPQDPILHRLVDLKTYDEMPEPDNWLELLRVMRDRLLLWMVSSTEFLADGDAARRRLQCFKQLMWMLAVELSYTHSLLQRSATAFRRWRCVEVVLGELRGMWPGDLECFGSGDSELRRAMHDAVRRQCRRLHYPQAAPDRCQYPR